MALHCCSCKVVKLNSVLFRSVLYVRWMHTHC